jgi:hypothetical protein
MCCQWGLQMQCRTHQSRVVRRSNQIALALPKGDFPVFEPEKAILQAQDAPFPVVGDKAILLEAAAVEVGGDGDG